MKKNKNLSGRESKTADILKLDIVKILFQFFSNNYLYDFCVYSKEWGGRKSSTYNPPEYHSLSQKWDWYSCNRPKAFFFGYYFWAVDK